MKKFIKENWFKLSFISLLSVVALFAAYYFAMFLPAQQQKNDLIKQQAGSSIENNFDSQTKCADMAGKWLVNNGYKYGGDGSGGVYIYKNHFNYKMSKCFVLISVSDMNNKFSLYLDLYDVVEGKHYASYMGHSICDPSILNSPSANDPGRCKLDSGNIWYDGNDLKSPADFTVGFRGYKYGSNTGDENTLNQFMDQIQPFMNN